MLNSMTGRTGASSAGLFDTEAQPDRDEEEDEQREDDELEGQRVIDRVSRIRRMDAELLEQRIEGRREPVIQQVGKKIDPGQHDVFVSCEGGEAPRWKERQLPVRYRRPARKHYRANTLD